MLFSPQLLRYFLLLLPFTIIPDQLCCLSWLLSRVLQCMNDKATRSAGCHSAGVPFIVPLVVETLGGWCEEAMQAIRTIGQLSRPEVGVAPSWDHFTSFPAAAVRLWRGNAISHACMVNLCPSTSPVIIYRHSLCAVITDLCSLDIILEREIKSKSRSAI